MIIHEFCSMYLECEHVHESHSCTVSSVAQLLCDLHEIMDTREREEIAHFVSCDASILATLSLAVSRHRKCKLHLWYLFLLSNRPLLGKIITELSTYAITVCNSPYLLGTVNFTLILSFGIYEHLRQLVTCMQEKINTLYQWPKASKQLPISSLQAVKSLRGLLFCPIMAWPSVSLTAKCFTLAAGSVSIQCYARSCKLRCPM